MKTGNLLLALSAFASGVLWASVHGCSGGSLVARADNRPADAGVPSNPSATCALPNLTPTTLAHYADLVTALQSGAHVRVVADYAKCTLDGKPGPAAVGGLSMDTFELFGTGLIGNAQPFIGVSQAQLIKFDPDYVYDYVRINVNADDTVDILVNYLNPTTFAVTVDETLSCRLNDGSNGAGVTLFKAAS